MAEKLYLYQLGEDGTPFAYDESMAVACMQGLFNRTGPHIYVTCHDEPEHENGITGKVCWGGWDGTFKREHAAPHFWLKAFTENGGWLHDREQVQLSGLDELFEITESAIKGIIIWDENVPSTVNVATTVAGVEDLIVMSRGLYEGFGKRTGLPVKHDLTGKFDGSISGSSKNDAYRWAIENYLKKGLCSNTLVGHYNDAWYGRKFGYTGYVLERDRLIAERAFAFDLCVWDTFTPEDDPNQPLGTDKETMLMIFKTIYDNCKGENMTEFCGFLDFRKQEKWQPNGVITEWEQVYIMSPYNFYQNTAAHAVYNQSLHKWAPSKPLKQHRPKVKKIIENKTYFCIQICDMDSTTPLYETMPVLWADKRRGEIPLAWGINPNLAGILPDIFEYYYKSPTDNDYFVADSCGAGYFNPTLIKPEHWNMVREHNTKWFKNADMTITGMALDGEHPTDDVLKNFSTFSPDGYGPLISGYRGGHNPRLSRQVFNGMPINYMTNGNTCDWEGVEGTRDKLNYWYFSKLSDSRPEFVYLRICYRFPSELIALYKSVCESNPKLDIELVDPYTFYDLVRQDCTDNNRIDPQIGSSM